VTSKLARILAEEGILPKTADEATDDGELFDKREAKTATMYSPDESFYDSVLDAANEAHREAQSIDGPKGRAAKKLYTDLLKALVKQETADGVDPKKMRKIINDTWRQVHR